MGGLLRLFDFSYERMARKVLTSKHHDDGFEAPRNSFELQAEFSQSNGAAENTLVEEDWYEEGCYPVEASMKKLINDELSKPSNTRANGPSVVARLMGMDMLPVDTKPVVQPNDNKKESKGVKLSKKGKSRRGSVSPDLSKSDFSKLKKFDSFYDHSEGDDDCRSSLKKPRPREHPQEEELQKFKKEFLAWQAARFKEYAKVADISEQFIAQEILNMRKMELYSMSEITTAEEPIEIKNPARNKPQYTGSLQNDKNKMGLVLTDNKNFLPLTNKTLTRDLEESNFISSNTDTNTSYVPTKIVILKPGPEKISDPDSSWHNTSTLEAKGSIHDFLEEVKERLKFELQGKSFKQGTVARGSGIETPFSEKQSDQKHIAHHIATQVREKATRGTESYLLRSESTRSYRNDIYSSGPCSPEFISRDTRKFLTDRMKNVLQREVTLGSPAVPSSQRSSALKGGRAMQKERGESLRFRDDIDCWSAEQGADDMQTRSFRHQSDDGGVLHIESPGNLVRSLSAPVSRTSFGKLLLEDRRIHTGAHIRRKLEDGDSSSKDLRKSKKERFNIKEKVSHLGHSLTLRGRLFGRKHHSATIRHGIEQNSVKDIMSGPRVLNLGERHENFTEVPPSPVSVCSSIHEELWRPADVSPASTPDMAFGENITVSHVFSDISSNLKELRRQLNQLDSDGPEDTMSTKQSSESDIIELEDPAEVYVRDLLVASGLYDGSSEVCLSRWDSIAKPINNSVFEQVEESYMKLAKDHDSLKDHEEWREDHKILLDLLNEALSVVFGPPVTLSKFRRKFMHSSMRPPLRGRKLLDTVWKIINTSLYPPSNISCRSLENIVNLDLESIPWSGLMDDEVNLIGREVESLIIADLIDNVTRDIYLR